VTNQLQLINIIIIIIIIISENVREGEVTRGWRKLRKKKLHGVYSSPNITRLIKSKRVRRAGRVACKDEDKNAYRILVGKHERKNKVEEPGIYGRIILNGSKRNGVVGCGLGSSGTGLRDVERLF